MERFLIWMLERPSRILALGWTTTQAGCALLLLSAYGKIMLVASSFSPKPPSSLSDLNLPFPTFFLPESGVGYACTALLISTGMLATWWARGIQRRLRLL